MAERDQILERLYVHLRPLTPAHVELTPETDLVGTLGLDSTTVINIVLDVEDEYDVSVPLNALADIRTAGELADLIHRLCEDG
ncbi:MAG: acyl carrier protein [Gemmatimonadetes bacterium]|nr:MAG: acyl carrier protein [Gemmatimonadota bacterium]